MCFNYCSHSDIKPWVFLSCSLCLSSVSLPLCSIFPFLLIWLLISLPRQRMPWLRSQIGKPRPCPNVSKGEVKIQFSKLSLCSGNSWIHQIQTENSTPRKYLRRVNVHNMWAVGRRIWCVSEVCPTKRNMYVLLRETATNKHLSHFWHLFHPTAHLATCSILITTA